MSSGKQKSAQSTVPVPMPAISGPLGTKDADHHHHSTAKKYGIAMLGEFVGTFLFLLFGFGGVQAMHASSTNSSTTPTAIPALNTFYIAASFGTSLAVNAWIFYRISGGLFNPAVTFGLVILGEMPVEQGVLLVVSQLVGAITAAGVIEGLLPGGLVVVNTLGPNVSLAQGVFLEMFLTVELCLTIFLLAVEKHRATFMAPVAIGLSLFLAHLFGVQFSGASLNPARSFGPAVVTRFREQSDHWVYWVGPLLGAAVAAGFYRLLKKLNYECANPKQDHDGLWERDVSSSDAPLDQGRVSANGSDAV